MSIRRYLVLILISIITLLSFIAAIEGYKASMAKASDLFDGQLSSVAQTLIAIQPQQKSLNIANNDHLAFQYWQTQSQGPRLLAKTSNAPENAISHFKEGFSENNFDDQRWRIYTLKNTQRHVWLMVAQSIKPRFDLAEQVILSAVTPIILTIPILSLIIFLVISRGLKPLTHLTKQLTKKKINDLSIIKLEHSSKELKPVVETLNRVLTQLDNAFEREKRFASDAAHELRTPLSVLKINVHNLQHEIGEQSSSLNHLIASVDRMAHVVEQILKLNRTDPSQFASNMQILALPPLIQQAIAQLYNEITQRNQIIEFCKLEFQHSDKGDIKWEKNHNSKVSSQYTVYGDEFSLMLLLQNLISNASKYTPEQGTILVTLKHHGEHNILTVEDSGPGIPTQELEKVFERFYRIGGDQNNSNVVGCGLGLSIVKHIVTLHHASIELDKSPSLQGLRVTLSFPNNKQVNELI